ncbi:MAG: ABC transporter permease, partial [Gemmatimonadota bacterium]
PAFTLVASLTVALGIGATVSIFSVVKAVVLDPLPYRSPDRLAAIWEWNVPRDRRENVANPGNVRAWRDRSRSFADMAAITPQQPLTMTSSQGPEQVLVRMVTPNFFQLLGLRAALGRTLTASDSSMSGGTPVVLSHRFWQRRFGGDPGVVGRTLTIAGESAVVVGVLPQVYVTFGEGADLWAAWPLRGDQTTSGRYLYVVGRLADGVTMAQANDELSGIAAGLAEEYPDFDGGWTTRVVPLQNEVVGDARTPMLILFGAVGLLLLIACANVANLLLAAATERQQELAVRTSLGATGGRLVGQLLVESLVLAFLGAAGGVWLARVGTGLVARVMPNAFVLPRVENAGLDGTVLLFAVGLTVLTGLLFGLAPAVQATRTAPAQTLNAEGRGPSRRTGRLRSGLVVAEVAVSAALLVGAMLLARSFASLTAVDPGLDPQGVLTARISLSGPAYRDRQKEVRFFDDLVERVKGLPGVVTAGGVTFLPMNGQGAATTFHVTDKPTPPKPDWPAADIRNVVGDYFGAMRIRLLRGRLFDARDRADAPAVAVVNRRLAETQWPGENPLGKHLKISWGDLEEVEVVGVVDNVRLEGLDRQPRGTVYLPMDQKPYFGMIHLTVRTAGDPMALVPSVNRELHALDPGVPMADVQPMRRIVRDSVARPRLTATLMELFAILALLLAGVGLYGVLSYTVAQRSHEIGVRMAMGARPGAVLRLVLGQGLRLAGLGVALGVAGALAGGRLLSSLLFGIGSADPLSFGAAAVFLLAVAAFASAIPAWRAARLAPATVLKE